MGDTLVFQRDYLGDITIYQGNGAYYFVNRPCTERELTLGASLALGGTFVFTELKSPQCVDFYEKLIQYMRRLRPDIALLWVVDASLEPWAWKSYRLYCEEKGTEQWRFGHYSELKFGDYRLIFHGRNVLFGQKDKLFVRSAEQGDIDIKDRNALPGIFQMKKFSATVSTEGFELDFSEGNAGNLRFDIEGSGNETSDVFEQMDACIKYCAPLSGTTKEGWRQGYVGTISSPLLFWTGSLKLQVMLQPIELENHSRTYFLLYDEAQPEQAYDTSMIDIGGQSKKLVPGSDARLVFERMPRYLHYNTKSMKYSGAQTYYLGFAGQMSLKNPEKHLLCGLSGTEFMDLTTAASLQLNFCSQQNSFFGETGEQALSTTARISFPHQSSYYSQPEMAPMYTRNETGALRFLEVPTTRWTNTTPPVPMAFYNQSRISFRDSGDIQNIEKNIYKKRYELITGKVILEQKLEKAVDSGVKICVTPQGLMAGVNQASGGYEWFAIAQTDASQELPTLRFTGISEELRMKLQNSKLFLNIEDRESFLKDASPAGDFKLIMDGWSFLLSPKDWKTNSGERNTAFIMKYVKGVSMKELLSTSSIFQASLNSAYDDRQQVLPKYKDFVHCIEDPDFQGIIFLNCMVAVGELPPEVVFLLKGVHQEDFFAHHVILRNNKVNQDKQGNLYMEATSIQALINYQSGKSIVYDESMPDYLFTTTQLTVSFLNSTLQSFSSVSEVFINCFYGAKSVKEETTSGNCLIIDGISQRKDEVEEYVFSLRESCTYLLTNSGMKEVSINSAQLSVGQALDGIGRITFSGGIKLAVLEECDILSFDSLTFNSLQMVVPTEGMIYLDYDNIVLNLGSAVLREQSFGARFACELERLCYERKQLPEELGYDTVTTPIQQSKLENPWTGLVWKLSLGSLGELSNSGELAIRLLVSWSIGTQGPEYYVGLLLPSVLEGFDLQGILKLGFQSVELMVAKGGDAIRYTLRLHNYTLRLLWLAIPPGSNDLFIFADGKKLGWYAAYLGEEV